MAKVNKFRRSSGSRQYHRGTRCSLSSISNVIVDSKRKRRLKESERKEWKVSKCSVCLEYPHNAVLLLCSSYQKGCRPYMCATSSRYSNCLDQYKKAYTKDSSNQDMQLWDGSIDEANLDQLPCPLCRGQVKGWTVVKRARRYFNSKKRSCMHDKCSFVGTYKELRKHVRSGHPWARPREVDPKLAEKWKKFENERERRDVMSTISSTMPGSVIVGDYVLERGYGGGYRDYNFSGSNAGRWDDIGYEPWEDDYFDDLDMIFARRHSRPQAGRGRSVNGRGRMRSRFRRAAGNSGG